MPFLDHNLVEFLARVPPHLKLKDCTGKSLLKKLAEPLADHNIIFFPMGSWLMGGIFRTRPVNFQSITTQERRFFLQRVFQRTVEETPWWKWWLQPLPLDSSKCLTLIRVLD